MSNLLKTRWSYPTPQGFDTGPNVGPAFRSRFAATQVQRLRWESPFRFPYSHPLKLVEALSDWIHRLDQVHREDEDVRFRWLRAPDLNQAQLLLHDTQVLRATQLTPALRLPRMSLSRLGARTGGDRRRRAFMLAIL